MANEKNLVRGDEAHKFTPEEHSKGGKASAKARAEKRDLRKALEMLLEKEYKGKDTNGEIVTMSGAELIALKQMQKAMKGDTKAFEVVRDTAGQKPIDTVKTTQTVIDMSKFTTEQIKDMLDDEI